MWVRGACALTLLCVASLGSLHSDKRAEMAPVPFVLGSRYGRSPPRQLSPRNDRFFMGSRYGKRSEPALTLSALAERADRQGTLTGRQGLLEGRPGAGLTALTALAERADRQGALTGRQSSLEGRPSALTTLTQRSVAPSLLWQAATLLASRSHRTFDNEP